MLSILIPVFNYDASPLVQELKEQIEKLGISYEIIVLNDASTSFLAENQTLKNKDGIYYEVLETNIGRSKIRNLLCQKAQFEWVLLLDCDTKPTNDIFIKKYVDCIANKEDSVFFGGLAYEPTRPEDDRLLRWIYGQKREAIPIKIRQKNSYDAALVSNILLKRNIILEHPFDTSINNYGFEDFVFIHELKRNAIPINHIDNPVFHLNLEKSTVFLEKHLNAINNLHYLMSKKIISIDETKLGKTKRTLSRFGLKQLTIFLFNLTEASLKKNLLSTQPSLFLFDVYKLGYFCSIKKY